MTTAVVDALMAYDKNNVNPGLLGFVVVALLGVATWLLIRSMQRQLGKVDFDEEADAVTTDVVTTDVVTEVGPDPNDSGKPERQR